MPVTHVMPASRFLIALGIVGSVLQRGEQPLTEVRTTLRRKGYSNNEISTLFDAIRNGHIRGVSVNIRSENAVVYWQLMTTWS